MGLPIAGIICLTVCALARGVAGWSVGDAVPLYLSFRSGDEPGAITQPQPVAPPYAPIFGIDKMVTVPYADVAPAISTAANASVHSKQYETILSELNPHDHIKLRIDLGVVRRRTAWITLVAPQRPEPGPRYLTELILDFSMRGSSSTFGEIVDIIYKPRYSEVSPRVLILRYQWVARPTLFPAAGILVTVVASLVLISIISISSFGWIGVLGRVMIVKRRDD